MMANNKKQGSKKASQRSIAYAPSCFASHPALKLGEGEVFGGSAITPMVKDADIYVALEGSARFTLSDPWDKYQITNVRFNISDSYAPQAAEIPRFKKMVTYLCNQLQAGKKIHIGCIGGHGRTGLVLSAMAAELGHKDAIQYVRQHYCAKAVESDEQVKFLEDNYGVTYAAPNKTFVSSALWGNMDEYLPTKGKAPKHVSYKAALGPVPIDTGKSKGAREVFPVASARSLWKPY